MTNKIEVEGSHCPFMGLDGPRHQLGTAQRLCRRNCALWVPATHTATTAGPGGSFGTPLVTVESETEGKCAIRLMGERE